MTTASAVGTSTYEDGRSMLETLAEQTAEPNQYAPTLDPSWPQGFDPNQLPQPPQHNPALGPLSPQTPPWLQPPLSPHVPPAWPPVNPWADPAQLLLAQTYWQQQVQALAHQQALAHHQTLMYLQACAAGNLPLQNLANQLPPPPTFESDPLKEESSKTPTAFDKLVSLVAAGELKESHPCAASPSPQVTTPLKGEAEEPDYVRTPPKGSALKPAKSSGKVWANKSGSMDDNENQPPQWKTQTMVTPGAYSPDMPKPR